MIKESKMTRVAQPYTGTTYKENLEDLRGLQLYTSNKAKHVKQIPAGKLINFSKMKSKCVVLDKLDLVLT